jgi:hypothetical protein
MARGVAGLSPLGLWRFGQAAGATASNEVGGASAALFNGAAFTAGALQGGGVRLEGVNDLVQVNHAGADAPASGAVSVWFRADALGRAQGGVSKNSAGLDAGVGFTFLMNADGALTFTLTGAPSVSTGDFCSACRAHSRPRPSLDDVRPVPEKCYAAFGQERV